MSFIIADVELHQETNQGLLQVVMLSLGMLLVVLIPITAITLLILYKRKIKELTKGNGTLNEIATLSLPPSVSEKETTFMHK